MADSNPLPLRYYSCLMRLWREDESLPWRVQLQHAGTSKPLLFPDLLAALAFIEGQLSPVASRDSLAAPIDSTAP